MEKRIGERTHPCGAPVFTITSSDNTGSLLREPEIQIQIPGTFLTLAPQVSVSGSTCQCCKLKQCHMLQVIKVSVCCRLSQCQCVASSHDVSVLQALTMSVCCTH